MALTPAILVAALQGSRSSGSVSLMGPDYDRIVVGIAQAIFQWGVGQPQNLALTGSAVGSAGVGAITPVTTRITVPPSFGIMLSALTGAGVKGPTGVSMASAVSNGISLAFSSSAQYTGVSSTVGAGQDISRITVANAATLIALLNANLGNGPSIGMLSNGLGNGIASMLLQGVGTGTVTGIPTPFAATGVTFSTVV